MQKGFGKSRSLSPYYIRKQPEDSSSPGRLLPLGCTCTGYPVFAAMLHSIKHAKRICCAKKSAKSRMLLAAKIFFYYPILLTGNGSLYRSLSLF